MKRTYKDIGVALSTGMIDFATATRIISKLDGKYVTRSYGKYGTHHTLPTYYIKSIDIPSSKAIVQPIIHEKIKVSEKGDGHYERHEVTTFRYGVSSIEKTLKISISSEGLIKLGTVRTSDYNLLTEIPSEQDVTTYQRYYD